MLLSVLLVLAGCGEADNTSPPTTRAELDNSIRSGRDFLIRIQRPEGNFRYETNFLTGVTSDDDHPVRQAGAIWALALLHQHETGDDTRAATEKGLAFFSEHSQTTDDGRRFITYPGRKRGWTNTLALVTMTLVDFLQADPNHPQAEEYRTVANELVDQMQSLRMKDGLYHARYSTQTGNGADDPSPFSDGEVLLALAKAALHLERDDLKDSLLESGDAMFRRWFLENKKQRKQFYQWGSMAFLEIYRTKWKGSEVYAERSIEMANWLVDDIEDRQSKYNTSTSYEGLISAWEIARLTENEKAKNRIERQIDKGVRHLHTFQVGNPSANAFLKKNAKKIDDEFLGGVIHAPDSTDLRIDVTQHQMHALILARRYVYRD
jgi:UDP-N-acetylmuramoyl-tripeptide--D-alanyl-D-alanine ligase